MTQEQESRRVAFSSSVALTTITHVLLGALGLITGSMVARLLGAEGRGELAAIQAWPNFIAAMAMLGLPDALVYYSARERDQAGRYLVSASAFAAIASAPFMLAGYLAMPLLLAQHSPEVITAARWYLLLAPLYAVVFMPPHSFRGQNQLLIWSLLRLMPGLGWIIVLALAFLGGRSSPTFVAAAYLIMMALLFFPTIAFVVRRIAPPFRLEARKVGQMLRYGLPSAMSGISAIMNMRLDQLLMIGLVPAHTLGIYVVAVAWSNVSSPLLYGLSTALFPRVASLRTTEEQVRALTYGSRLGSILAICVAIFFAAITPWVLPVVFGESFEPGVPAAIILVLAAGIMGLNLVVEEGLRGLGYPAAVMWSELGGTLVAILLLFVLLGPLGITGAAIASLVGYSSVLLTLLLQGSRITGCSILDFICPTRRELISLVQSLNRLRQGLVSTRSGRKPSAGQTVIEPAKPSPRGD